jgi:tripeptidyl-peptidase-1|eukprot:COSAG01_NODE_2251_length_8072_cov_4.157723_7_plen_251_part_00
MQVALALAALAVPASAADYHAQMPYVNGWNKSPVAVQDTEMLSITIVLREQGQEEIRRMALSVSDPSSPEYGRFLTRDQVQDITRPKADHMSAVTAWLDSHGVGFKIQGVSNLLVDIPAVTASKLFETTFHRAENRASGQALVRAADFSVPDEVAAATQSIFGLHGLPLPPREAVIISSHESAKPKQPAKVTPKVLSETYGISGVKVSRSTKNKQAVAEFQGQFMNSSDLAVLFDKYHLRVISMAAEILD